MRPKDLGLSEDKFPSYRRGQEDLILDLAACDTRTSILRAPTGAGKSLVNVSLGLLEGWRTLYLTATKGLQTQLLDDFASAGMTDIRGHKNYDCAAPSAGRYDEDLCSRPSNCLHRAAMSRAAEANLVVSNYAKWVTMSVFTGRPEELGKFDLLICDEAHNTMSWMTSLLSLEFSSGDTESAINMVTPGFRDSIETWIEWGQSAVLAAEKKYLELKAQGGDDKSARMRHIARLGKDLRRLSELSGHRTEWVVDQTKYGSVLMPKWPAEYTEQHLFRGIKRVVLSSADINEYDARDLGIKPNDLTVTGSKYSFDPDRRPLYWLDMQPPVRVQNGMSPGARKIWIQRMDRVLESFSEHKAIIQPRSYGRCKEIIENSRWSQHMITHKPGRAEGAIAQFKRSSAPSILVSPAIEEGVDFPYDEARLCIIAKVPFLYLKDPLTAARRKDDPTYADRIVCRDILQMAGRTMRAEDDWTVIVIPDDHWSYFRNKPFFPNWLRKSFRKTSTIPKPLGAPGP